MLAALCGQTSFQIQGRESAVTLTSAGAKAFLMLSRCTVQASLSFLFCRSSLHSQPHLRLFGLGPLTIPANMAKTGSQKPARLSIPMANIKPFTSQELYLISINPRSCRGFGGWGPGDCFTFTKTCWCSGPHRESGNEPFRD